jgi:signal transduction histidine kinase
MRRILLVEGDPDERRMMRDALTAGENPFDVDEAASGLEALEKLRVPPGYDLVVLDCMLPGCDGLDVIDKMRSADLRTPVVLVACADRARIAMQSLGLGISELVLKGVDFMPDLPQIVQGALDKSGTARKAQRAREEREFQAEKLARLGRILSEVLHDLRNPLSIISTSLEAIRDAKDKEKAVGMTLELMLRNIERSRQLINSLLDYSRPKELSLRPADLCAVVAELVEHLRLTCEKQGIALRFDRPAGVPEAELDVQQVKGAVLNLLMNAVQAMPKGGSLTVAVSEDLGQREVRLEIADTGVGIKLEDQKHLFERYFTTKPQGTGLGLIMVREVVRQHHGGIRVKSGEGAGTTFTLTFPVAQRR